MRQENSVGGDDKFNNSIQRFLQNSITVEDKHNEKNKSHQRLQAQRFTPFSPCADEKIVKPDNSDNNLVRRRHTEVIKK